VISVFRGGDYIEAQLVAGLLRQAGVEVFLQGAFLQGALGDLPATGHLAIFVDESDRSAAEDIIKAYERGELSIDEDSEPPIADTPN
jgi:hypothetical protein